MALSRRRLLLAGDAGIVGGALGAAPPVAADEVSSQAWETVIGSGAFKGSSGSSGPTGDTYYRARNIYVGRTDNG